MGGTVEKGSPSQTEAGHGPRREWGAGQEGLPEEVSCALRAGEERMG